MLNFQSSFVLEVYIMDLESREVSLNGNVYNSLGNYNSIDKSDILKIGKYLMAKNIKK